ncbi:MAG: FAD-dependent oxidoreductase [Candidatus Omnitrophica bacterium]|nr:FAD-dependent oxidoreductase [Candidatus Omnitrophota bacterium]
MKDITVIGGGISGFTLIEQIREKNIDCRITLIDINDYNFYKNELLIVPGKFSNRIKLADWAEKNKVKFIKDKVEKINIKRGKIYLKQGETRDFEELVLASGVKSKKIEIKGEHREGFFYLSDITPGNLRSLLKISSDIAVNVTTFVGIELSLALKKLGKEVRVVSANFNFLGEYELTVIEALKAKGIGVYINSIIEEAVGEGILKATKILPLKVFPSQLIFIDSGFIPNNHFFGEDIVIKDTFFTDYENVYLLGDVNKLGIENELFFVSNFQEAKKQGAVLADFFSDGITPEYIRPDIDGNNIKKIIDNIFKEGELWQSGLA